MTEHDAQIAFYAALVFTMAFCAWLSLDRVIQVLALILVGIWASSNVALAVVGYNGEPLLVPTMDAIAAIGTAMVGYRNKSRLALTVFGLFVILGVVHVVAFAANVTTTALYYGLKNLIFVLQLGLVGGAGILGLVRRLSSRHSRARSYRSGRA